MSSNLIPWGNDLDLGDLVLTTRRLTVAGGVGFVRGEVGYISAADTVQKAVDTSAAAAEGRAICLSAAVANGALGLFLVAPGIVDGLAGGTAGALGYVSHTAGGITTTAPTTAGRYSKILGRWLSTTAFLFDPDVNAYPIAAY